MRKMKPEICPYCERPIPKGFHEARAKAKGKNVADGLAAAKAAGKAIGRPKTRDDEAIRALRKRGLSMTEIAKTLGISTQTVHSSLKEAP